MTDLGRTHVLADATRDDLGRMAQDFTPQDEADGGGWMPLLMFFGAGFLAAYAVMWLGIGLHFSASVAAFGSATAAVIGLLFRASRRISE